MTKRFVVCKINEEYLRKVKNQMKKHKMPIPKNYADITIAHKPIVTIDTNELCDCKVCKKLLSEFIK